MATGDDKEQREGQGQRQRQRQRQRMTEPSRGKDIHHAQTAIRFDCERRGVVAATDTDTDTTTATATGCWRRERERGRVKRKGGGEAIWGEKGGGVMWWGGVPYPAMSCRVYFDVVLRCTQVIAIVPQCNVVSLEFHVMMIGMLRDSTR